jgi:hypothetical protein
MTPLNINALIRESEIRGARLAISEKHVESIEKRRRKKKEREILERARLGMIKERKEKYQNIKNRLNKGAKIFVSAVKSRRLFRPSYRLRSRMIYRGNR